MSTRGCAAATSFLKWRSVPNGVAAAASSRTSTSRLPTVTEPMPKAGRAWVRPARAINSYAAVRLRVAEFSASNDEPPAATAMAAQARTGTMMSDCV
jgi:hypothetical protein